jgi:hypothetical protein
MDIQFHAKLTALSLGLLVAGSVLAAPPKAVTLKKGTMVPVTLDQALTADHSRRGDTFTVTVRSGYLGLAEGTQLKGIAHLEAGVKDMLDQLVWWTRALKTARDQDKLAAAA